MQSGKSDLSEEVFQTRLAVTHAVHESARAIDMLYHASGTMPSAAATCWNATSGT